MIDLQTRVVRAARGWIGTPYRHQGSRKGAGADCLGLVRGVWRDVLGAEPEAVPAYTMDWSEPQAVEELWQAAIRHFLPKQLEDETPGDLLLFRMCDGAVAKHVGIAGDVGTQASFIHAYSCHAVVESPLSTPWRRRIVARFAFPDDLRQEV
ncbi:MAG: NlpC/P60 family protein [Pseudomonadota bacterium]